MEHLRHFRLTIYFALFVVVIVTLIGCFVVFIRAAAAPVNIQLGSAPPGELQVW